MKKIIFVPLAALVLTGCTATVDDKYYMPEFTRGHEECFRSSRQGCLDGKEFNVKVPECWRIVIEEGIDTTNICVPKDVWEKTQVGQEWTDETYAF